MAASINSQLMDEVAPPVRRSGNKVTVVGAGQVGAACAFSLLTQGLCSELALVDVDERKLKGELLDLQHGLAFLKAGKISGSSDYAVSAGSRLCIVTAGCSQRDSRSRDALTAGASQRDSTTHHADLAGLVATYRQIIPQLVKHSPDAVLLIVSSPVDIMTHVAWKLSGLASSRVLGAGCNLDSSRLRFHLSEQLGVAPACTHGWIIGEHGDSSVPVWSGVNVAGVLLTELDSAVGTPEGDPRYEHVHQRMVDSAEEVVRLKGHTSWAIGLSVASIAASILHNRSHCHCVSVCVKGQHGITEEVYLSLPAVLGGSGVSHVVRQPLRPEELLLLRRSAARMAQLQRGLGL